MMAKQPSLGLYNSFSDESQDAIICSGDKFKFKVWQSVPNDEFIWFAWIWLCATFIGLMSHDLKFNVHGL